jgi:Transglutaminase-like superfamily
VKRVSAFIRLPFRDRLLLLEAVLALATASIVLRTVTFARLAKYIGRHMTQSPSCAPEPVEQQAMRVRWAVDVAANNLPWKPVCFPRAIAATAMLKRRGIGSTLYFGVDAARGLDAHAWVRVGSLIVSGAPVEPRFTVVSTFA